MVVLCLHDIPARFRTRRNSSSAPTARVKSSRYDSQLYGIFWWWRVVFNNTCCLQLALGWKLRRYHGNAQAPKSHLAKSNVVFHDQMENGSCREKSSRGSVVNQWTFYGVFNNDGSPTLYFIDLTFFIRHDILCNRYNTVLFSKFWVYREACFRSH